MIVKNSHTCGTKYTDCECCFEYIRVKDDFIVYKYLCCNKNYQKRFDKSLRNLFSKTCKFSNNDIIKSILLLRKRVYPFEYLHDWEKLNETLLPEKGDIFSSLNMKDITDADYTYTKRISKNFETKI